MKMRAYWFVISQRIILCWFVDCVNVRSEVFKAFECISIFGYNEWIWVWESALQSFKIMMIQLLTDSFTLEWWLITLMIIRYFRRASYSVCLVIDVIDILSYNSSPSNSKQRFSEYSKFEISSTFKPKMKVRTMSHQVKLTFANAEFKLWGFLAKR